MSALSLRYFAVRLRFNRLNKVRELDDILNEEHGNIAVSDIPITLLRVEFYGKVSNTTDSIL